jgi:hypothetical protein
MIVVMICALAYLLMGMTLYSSLPGTSLTPSRVSDPIDYDFDYHNDDDNVLTKLPLNIPFTYMIMSPSSRSNDEPTIGGGGGNGAPLIYGEKAVAREISTGMITIDVWIKVHVLDNDVPIMSVLHWSIQIMASQLAACIDNRYGGSRCAIAVVPIQIATWMRITLTFDAHRLSLYINGRLDVVLDDSVTSFTLPSSLLRSNGIVFGHGHENAQLSYSGCIGHVAIWSWSLTSDDINRWHTSHNEPLPKLVALDANNAFTDRHITSPMLARALTVSSLPYLGARVIPGVFHDFVYTSGPYSIGRSVSLMDVSSHDHFTVATWLRLNAPRDSGTRTKSGDIAPTITIMAWKVRWKLTIGGHDDILILQLYLDGGDILRLQSPFPLSHHRWYHIAWTFDVSTPTSGVTFYIDGWAVARDRASSRLYGDEEIKGTVIPLTIGSQYINDSLSLIGSISDIRIWNVALTPSQIRLIYNRALFDDTSLPTSIADGVIPVAILDYMNVAISAHEKRTIRARLPSSTSSSSKEHASPQMIFNSFELPMSKPLVHSPGLPSVMSTITVEVWARPTQFADIGHGRMCLLSLNGQPGAWRLCTHPSGAFMVEVAINNGNHRMDYISSRTLQLDTWYQLVWTYDGLYDTLYINGWMVHHSPAGSSTSGGGPLRESPVDAIISIGSCGSTEDGAVWQGSIAHVRIWSNVLDHMQIMSLLQRTLSKKHNNDMMLSSLSMIPVPLFDLLARAPSSISSALVVGQVPQLTWGPLFATPLVTRRLQDVSKTSEPVKELAFLIIGRKPTLTAQFWYMALMTYLLVNTIVESDLVHSTLRRLLLQIDRTSCESCMIYIVQWSADQDKSEDDTILRAMDDIQSSVRLQIVIPASKQRYGSWSAAANGAIHDIPNDWVLLLDATITPQPNAIMALWNERNYRDDNDHQVAAVIGQLLYPSGLVRSTGVHFKQSPSLSGDHWLPYSRYRGVPYGYQSSLTATNVDAFENGMILLQRSLVIQVGGWNEAMEPYFHHVDLSLHLTHFVTTPSPDISTSTLTGPTFRIRYTPAAVAYIDIQNDTIPEDEVWHGFHGNWLQETSMREFTSRWNALLTLRGQIDQMTTTRTRWSMYCGGSMGFEAGNMMNGIEGLAPIRAQIEYVTLLRCVGYSL